MKRLHDYLDYHIIKIYTQKGEAFTGKTVNVDYADENEKNEDMICIEQNGAFFGFYESDIDHIEILDEIEG